MKQTHHVKINIQDLFIEVGNYIMRKYYNKEKDMTNEILK